MSLTHQRLKLCKDNQEYNANLECDLFQFTYHVILSSFKICHYNFNLIKIYSNHKSEC